MIITGDSLTDAQPGFDSQNQQPKVDLTVDAKGGRIMRDVSRENMKKRMAILLFEKGKGEVLTAPVIQGELGNRFQISGSMTVVEANDLALLLRAGSLAALMEIIEERTIGPSLGAENIAKGFNSVTWGFLVIVAFMAAYYMLFGLFSGIALAVNLLLLVAILSMLQATLTLPGMAAMALALGMAIDSNVLINERVREEPRNGVSPQAAMGHDFRLQHHHIDCRSGLARLRVWPGARLCRGALHRHPDIHVFCRFLLARPGEPVVRTEEEAKDRIDRHRVAPGWRGHGGGGERQRKVRGPRWNFSRSGKTFRSCGTR